LKTYSKIKVDTKKKKRNFNRRC